MIEPGFVASLDCEHGCVASLDCEHGFVASELMSDDIIRIYVHKAMFYVAMHRSRIDILVHFKISAYPSRSIDIVLLGCVVVS